jgi:transposase
MIQITPQMRILLAVQPADFRKGIDGLARLCRQELDADPFSGALFVFRNRRGTSLKVLVYDGQGYWLCQKRLSAGSFRNWPGTVAEAVRELRAHELQVLISAGDPATVKAPPPWRRLPTPA